MSEFGDAFKAARKAGKMTFEFNGKKYGTRLANETKEQHLKKMNAQGSLSRDIMQKTGKNTGYKGELKPVAPASRKKEEKVSLPAKKAPSVVGASKPSAKPAAKESKAPRSGSAVSQTRQNEGVIKGLEQEAKAKAAKSSAVSKSNAEARKFVPSKPKAVIKEDMRESYKKERSVRGRKSSDKDYKRFKAMKEYAAQNKKVRGVAEKYGDVLDRARKLFAKGGKMKY
jgi:hypothetical protein